MHTNLGKLTGLTFFSSALEIYLGQSFQLDFPFPQDTESIVQKLSSEEESK